jgi:hypothetical protein
MAGIPGELLAQQFVDFSTTRNWALRVRSITLPVSAAWCTVAKRPAPACWLGVIAWQQMCCALARI